MPKMVSRLSRFRIGEIRKASLKSLCRPELEARALFALHDYQLFASSTNTQHILSKSKGTGRGKHELHFSTCSSQMCRTQLKCLQDTCQLQNKQLHLSQQRRREERIGEIEDDVIRTRTKGCRVYCSQLAEKGRKKPDRQEFPNNQVGRCSGTEM